MIDMRNTILTSLAALAGFLRYWQPRTCWRHDTDRLPSKPAAQAKESGLSSSKPAAQARDMRPPAHTAPGQNDSLRTIVWAWSPWAFLSVAVFCWGLPAVKATLEGRPQPAAATGATTATLAPAKIGRAHV